MMRMGLCYIVLLASVCAHSQTVFELNKEERNKPETQTEISFYVAMGPVNPAEVNAFIRDYIENRVGQYYISWGSSNITSVGMIGLAVAIPITPKIQSRIFLEYAGASKSVRLNSDHERFVINRFAPGVLVDYYFAANGFNAFYVEGGLYYGMTAFRDTKANGMGWKMSLGYSLFRPQVKWEIFIGVDLPSLRANENSTNIQKIDLAAPIIGLRLSLNG
jgi:hypothetical protein